MKVGFDISQTAHHGGVATYTKNLAQELSSLADLQMVFFYTSLRKSYKGNLKGVKSFKIPPTLAEILFNRLRVIPIEKFIGPLDIFHSSDWLQPKTKAKKVTTYHDVIPLKYPQWSHPKVVAVHKRRLQLVEKEIDIVITVSEATKKDLMEISQIPNEKIIVVYEAAGEHFQPQNEKEIKEFRSKYHLPKEFVLAIGGVGERRNLERVKEAAKEYNLVISGQDLPYLSDDQMPLLYSAAKVLLYPSFYEGFGLPILEAMACGTAVITSNLSSMPEVGGEAAFYVDPEDVEDIKKKLKAAMNDKQIRDDMIDKGFQQVKKFSWKRCAHQTASVYRDLVR
ncbi:MAG: Glycosyl transferase group 1 [Candidatus Daviesbacteria bacterium GW2011_GWA1_41_61]|nr:MAG: Glycosyl transferase group 1 [Candidatus Daviesbacteria bacterium GW2011_GWC1_40_9]KKR92934.1 MAG: Glycosyl transferase group 1 [Candidatus Daviesbacteria bacterium GW2011_GWB1_41_15]KKS15478.1 MAG: Glycosyl transferase group 1 [Candidatus Daviesbacteria bacterium GW2011_GWA1_41_61]